MAMLSRLFDGDKRLEAVQAEDGAHLTTGAKGDHVAKVQLALFALDGLKIDRGEIMAQRYAKSTAAAVLAYKTKRKIINHAYQSVPDDIVGKMTIAKLDQDMAQWERTHSCRGECACAKGAVPAARAFDRQGVVAALISSRPAASLRAAAPPVSAKPQLARGLRIYCSITKQAMAQGSFPLREHLRKAEALLSDYGLTLSNQFGSLRGEGYGDVINFPGSLVIDSDVALLRKVSEDARPGMPNILRIIVCPRSPNAPPGETYRHVTLGGAQFRAFVVLNSEAVSRDRATVIHEMIHAAQDRAVAHDTEPRSVFFEYSPAKTESVDRVWLTTERAIQLSNSYFAR